MEILNTNQCSDALESIIKSADKFVVIISPYIKLNPRVDSFLQMADDKDVPVFIVTRHLLDKEEYSKIKNLNRLVICIHPPLHAKTYFNENEVLISSLNLYEFSQQNNTEIGVRFFKKGYKDEFKDISDQLFDILNDKRSEIVVDKLTEKEWKKFEKDISGSWF